MNKGKGGRLAIDARRNINLPNRHMSIMQVTEGL